MKPDDELLSLAIKRFKEVPNKSEEPTFQTEDEVYANILQCRLAD